MAANKGNQFWKLRSKHGRDKLFETPDLLWEAACEYFQWCEDHPWIKNEAIKGGDLAGTVVKIDTARPYTLIGLCHYCDCSESYFRKFEDNNKDAKDFITALTRIREVIYRQKFEGAAVGAFSATIISRDLGLKENLDHTTKGDKFDKITVEIIHPHTRD